VCALLPPHAQSALENRRFGAPGVVNFVDARTRWFDRAVRDAQAAGIKQVRCGWAGPGRAGRSGKL
jgi:hypothetical protein